MKQEKRQLKGFTLIELLVVISIIMVLLAIGITSYQNAQKSGRDGRRKADLRQVQSALEMYRADYPTIGYPASSGGNILGCGIGGALACTWGEEWSADGRVYLSKLPLDPSSGPNYYYTQTGGGTGYTLKACIENTKDSEGQTDTGYSGCTSQYSYVVSNP